MSKSKMPVSRLMINYETNVDGVLKKKELPYKILVAGDLSKGRSKDAKKEFVDREVREVKNGVDNILKDMDISFDFEVPSFISKQADNIKVDYKVQSVKDFNPDSVAKKVPQINALLALKGMLSSFVKNIDNNRNLERLIDSVFSNKEELELLKKKVPNLAHYSMKENGGEPEPSKPQDTKVANKKVTNKTNNSKGA